MNLPSAFVCMNFPIVANNALFRILLLTKRESNNEQGEKPHCHTPHLLNKNTVKL